MRCSPKRWRTAVDWVATLVGATAIVLALKAWVVNPYRIPSSSMEPTLHCARPASGCLARYSDRVLADRLSYHFRSPRRGEIVVFHVPPAALQAGCARRVGDTFVKRLIGLPGEVVREDAAGYIWIDGRRLPERYVEPARRAEDTANRNRSWRVPRGRFFMIGDNRGRSCDSRSWGAVPRGRLIGRKLAVYWPPNRISTNWSLAGVVLLAGLVVATIAFSRRRSRRAGSS